LLADELTAHEVDPCQLLRGTYHISITKDKTKLFTYISYFYKLSLRACGHKLKRMYGHVTMSEVISISSQTASQVFILLDNKSIQTSS
jgi:hypothetical protein